MNLIADEGVDKPIVDALRNQGFDVIYILETHQGAKDNFILALAYESKRLLIHRIKISENLFFG